MALPPLPIAGTLDATSTASIVILGNNREGTISSMVFQVTGTPGGAFSGIVRGTMMDPASSPTYATLGITSALDPGTVVAAFTAAGIYKVQTEGLSQVEVKVDVAGTGSLPIRLWSVRG